MEEGEVRSKKGGGQHSNKCTLVRRRFHAIEVVGLPCFGVTHQRDCMASSEGMFKVMRRVISSRKCQELVRRKTLERAKSGLRLPVKGRLSRALFEE